MGIKQITPMSEIEAAIEAEIERVEKKIIKKFQYVGEACISEARNNGDYMDQTGNLRSSIGYIIVKDGSILYQGISESKSGSDRKEGVSQGKSLMEEIVNEFPFGIVLVVVAGMNYAGYVAAMGRNVLDSAELLAKQLVPQLLKEIGFK